jgi:hypothetical protein
MKRLLFFIALPLLATTTVQQVTEVSAQQAILRYRTTLSSSAACSWTITETVSGATPDDVNPSIFSGSNLDTRAGSLISNPDRAFVFGQRTSMAGSDGLLHSRSAKANTAYTAAYTCGSDTGTVYFSTGNIQAGGTYTEQPPVSSSGFGNWAWPTINWSSQSTQYADPLTGIVIRRATAPGWWGEERAPSNFDFAIGGTGYTNPQNILNGAACAGTSATCAQSTNLNPIFVASKFQNSGPCVSGYSSQDSCDDVLLLLTGSASASGAGPVTVCISYYDSGATCQSAEQTITLSTSVSSVGFPANGVGYTAPNNEWNPEFQFGEWGGVQPKRGDFGNAAGTASGYNDGVTTSGTAITVTCTNNNSSPSCFNPKWNNSYISIPGSGCTDGGTDICQFSGHPADTQHGTLKSAPATPCSSPCNWFSLASGFKITPNGAGTVNIGAQWSYAYSAMYNLLAEGDQQICNPVPVPGGIGYEADGMTVISPPLPGELCFVQFQDGGQDTIANGQLWLLIPSTGETRLLSPLFTPSGADTSDATSDQNSGQVAFPASPWDGVSGLCLYGMGKTQASGNPYAIYKGCYNTADNWKAYSHPLWACGICAGNSSSGVIPGQDPGVYWFCSGPCNSQRWSDDPVVYTNIMPGKNIFSQAAASNPTYISTIWPTTPTFDRILNGAAVITFVAQQDYTASFNFFSTSTGNITAWGDSMFSYATRFCGFHSSTASRVSPGYWGTACVYLDGGGWNLSGPYQGTPYYVYFSGAPTTDTAITTTSPLEACSNYASGIPANIQALITQQQVENRCMHIRMKNVVNHAPSSAELAKWPSSQNASWSEPSVLAPGDELAIGPSINAVGVGESDLVVSVTTGVTDAQCSSDCLDVVVARGTINCAVNQEVNCTNPVNLATGWVAVAGPTLGSCTDVGNCQPGPVSWYPVNATGALGAVGISDAPALEGHADGGPGLVSGKMTFVQGGKARYNLPLASQVGTFLSANLFGGGPFDGTTGGITLQSYVSKEQYNAPANELKWSTDFRHASPGEGGGPEEFIAIDPITYSLVSGFSTVYKVTNPAGGLAANEANYKTEGLQGWAGHNLLADASGPGSALSDSVAYQICIALAAGECVPGSAANAVYAAVPHVPSIQSNCITDWLVENYPCVAMSLPAVAGWLVQNDDSYSYQIWEGGRRLTMALTGYGRQYEYNTFIPENTGTWGMFKADWADGIRSEIFMARLPPFPGGNSVPRNTFVNYRVQVPGGPAYAEIEFGYMENGAANAYYCTSRRDACTTSGSPFVYPSIDSRTLLSCSSGCTINIPAIAGRAVYYSIGSSANGATWTYGTPQVGLVQ